jgi:voltage-gated potassium channel
MNPAASRVARGIAAIVILVAVGTAGYMTIEHMSLDDAVFMTVITITTVGYEEVDRLDTAGRIFTMGLIFTGVGIAYYVFAAVTEAVISGQLREMMGKSAMSRKIHQLENHVIVCGYGRFGRVVAEELRRHRMTVVVIDSAAEKEPELLRAGALHVIGSALEEQVLEQAAIRTASDIVIATASDPDNVYISLSARAKNPRIRIHARAESDIGLKHLELAGADQAISSYQWSAMRIANAIARPAVVDFLNLILPGPHGEEYGLEEVRVPDRRELAGKTIAMIERDNDNVRIVALKRGGDRIALVPAPQTEVRAGDLLVAIGARAGLRRLAEALAL